MSADMSKKTGVWLRRAVSGVLLLAAAAASQNLLAVLDLQSDGSVPLPLTDVISDSISAVLATDTSYMQFDRAMIPELLGQLALDQSAASCSEVQCLSLIGSLIGANTVIGGTVVAAKKTTIITLNLVDVAAKKLLNTIRHESRLPADILVEKEVPDLARELMNPGKHAPAGTVTKQKKTIFASPITYIGGVLFLGAAAGGGAYYYKNYYKAPAAGEPEPEPVPAEVDDSDAPQRTRGE